MTARDYLSERVIYGGIETTRGVMIADLQAKARELTDDPVRQAQMVNVYMAGLDRQVTS